MRRFVHRVVVGMCVFLLGGAAVVLAACEGGDRLERVTAKLPETREGSRGEAAWASADSVEALVGQSEVILVGRVVRTELKVEEQELTSGTHGFGDLVATIEVIELVKDSRDRPLTGEKLVMVPQFAQTFEGELMRYDMNPPLEEGETYLLFLGREPSTGELRVGDPFIHQVVNGRLYWAGARAHIAPNTPNRAIGFDANDPVMTFWDVPVDDAVGRLRGFVEVQGKE